MRSDSDRRSSSHGSPGPTSRKRRTTASRVVACSAVARRWIHLNRPSSDLPSGACDSTTTSLIVCPRHATGARRPWSRASAESARVGGAARGALGRTSGPGPRAGSEGGAGGWARAAAAATPDAHATPAATRASAAAGRPRAPARVTPISPCGA
jgi:hypothetical protein